MAEIKIPCPYPPTIVDDASGQVVQNPAYVYWMEGWTACAEAAKKMLEASTVPPYYKSRR